MKYEILVFFYGGGFALLSTGNRTSWGLRTAKKHLRDMVEKRLKEGGSTKYKAFLLQSSGVGYAHIYGGKQCAK